MKYLWLISTLLASQTVWSQESPNRAALIIGIGQYSEASNTDTLHGVPVDMLNARRMAKEMGIPNSNIVELRDSQATKENIQREFKKLAEKVKEGDRVFIYHSGHGTRYQQGNNCLQGLQTYTTGKFTAPESIEPKPYMIMCGLHTLYKENLRSIMDLTLYIDTDEGLKRFWKITRDMEHRGKTVEQVQASIEARTPDYLTYILPQREHADIIIRYKPIVPETYDTLGLEVSVHTTLVQEYTLTEKLSPFLLSCTEKENRTVYEFKAGISMTDLSTSISSYGYTITTLQNGYDGILQFLILCIIWRT